MLDADRNIWGDPPGYAEFFAGGGMARAGFGPGWRCLFANDIDPAKARAYAANWGDAALHVGDIHAVAARVVPGRPALVWGSFPCQDLSLAGAGAGLGGARSGAFHGFVRVVRDLAADGRAPAVVAVENVTGALSAGGGRDFAAMLGAFAGLGYRVGALVIDAAHFLPQSRPRLFVIAARDAPGALTAAGPDGPFHPPGLRRAVAALPQALRAAHLWWRLPAPPPRTVALADLLEPDGPGLRWRDPADTRRLMALMTPAHRARVAEAGGGGARAVGCVYRRTRRDAAGARVQRAEVRFDGLAGCLRTPAGGSSRQTVLVVEGSRVRSRLLTARETARLMGLDDGYRLPPRATDAYHLTGDGVAVEVVRWLRRHLFDPLVAGAPAPRPTPHISGSDPAATQLLGDAL